MYNGFKDENGKFHPIKNYKGISRKKRLSSEEMMEAHKGVKVNQTMHNEPVRLKRDKIKAEEISLRELQDHPLFEESTEWLDAFSESPEVIVADDRKGIFYIWFGGESHYIHEYTPYGNEVDVFSCCFEKNKLDRKDVFRLIEGRLNEKDEEE